jgi:hemolysin D
LHKAKLRRTLVELRADSDAVVQSIAKVSVGSVLQSGQQFFTLVPADAPLQVEAAIPGAQSGLVHLADKVAIKFDTFAFTQYGFAEGELKIISPNSFGAQDEARYPTGASQARNGPEIYYRGIVGITRLALRNMPEGFRLKPGMPVTADIKVGKRTVLQYLFDFVAPVASEAMREP